MYGEGKQHAQVLTAAMPKTGGFSSLRNRLIRGGLWVFAGRLGGVAGQFTLNLLLTRLLSLHDFGIFVLLTSIVVPVSTVAMLGFNRLAVKLIAEALHDATHHRLAAVIRLIAASSLTSIIAVSALAGLILSITLPRLVPGLDSWWVAPFVAMWIALLAAHQLVAEMLRGFHELKFASLVMGQNGGPIMTIALVGILLAANSLGSSQLSVVVIATVTALGLSLPVFVYWLVVTARYHGSRLQSSVRPAGSSSGNHPLVVRQIMGSCGLLVVGQLLLLAVNQGDLWISASLLGPADAAILGAARRLVLVAAVPSFLVNMTVVSCIPDLHTQRRLEELQRVLRSSASVATVLSLAVFGPLLLFPGFCLQIVYTPEYARGAAVVLILALGNLVYTWSGSSLLALQLTGHEKSAAVIQFVAAVFLFAAGPPVAREWGVTGLACVSATALAIVCVSSWLMARWSLGIWTHPSLGLPSASLLRLSRR